MVGHPGHTFSETFLDLDEVAAPSPVPREDEHRIFLEDANSQEKSDRLPPASLGRADSAIIPASNLPSRLPATPAENIDNVETLFHSRTSTISSSSVQESRTNGKSIQQGQGDRFRNIPQGYHGHLTDLSVPATIHEAHRNEEQIPDEKSSEKASDIPEVLTRLYTFSYLIIFSIWGTLARLGLQALTTYPAAPVTQGILWANVGGCLIIGFLAEDRTLFSEAWGKSPNSLARLPASERTKMYTARRKLLPLYIGLTTGFCGCFTSFSSWQRDALLAMVNRATLNSIPREGGYSFLALLATLVLTPALCMAALQVGAHLALALESVTPGRSFEFTRKILDPAMVPIALLSWFAAIILCIWPPDRPFGSSGHTSWLEETWRGDALFACVFAPLGCITRFYISTWLNPRLPNFPLGTFTVNMFGCILLAIFYDIQHASLAGGIYDGLVSCQILQGLMDGYCGSATTISTWILELKVLRRRHAYIYGFASTFVGLGFMIVVMGSFYWSRGFAASACGK